jgi:endonuclease/exonuclease/phosphatase (EEP) superfamily protein YafD
VEVDGARDVLAVWAMDDETNPRKRYIGQVYTALQQYRSFVESSAIVAGDFNWNVQLDESPKSPLCGNFAQTVRILNEIGLESVYHSRAGVEFGEEDDPTFFMHKKRGRPYHIDYIFAPEGVTESVREYTVGTYDKWIDASDHMPAIVRFDTS